MKRNERILCMALSKNAERNIGPLHKLRLNNAQNVIPSEKIGIRENLNDGESSIVTRKSTLFENFVPEDNQLVSHTDFQTKSNNMVDHKEHENDTHENILEDFDSDDSNHDPDFNPGSSFDDPNCSVLSHNETELIAKEMDVNLLNPAHEPDESTSKINDNSLARKKKRNSGAAYKTKSGSNISARSYKPLRLCRKKCSENISIATQKEIFETYWSLGGYDLRVIYIAGLIDVGEKKSQSLIKNSKAPRNRTHSSSYALDVNGKKIQVCRECFVNTLGEKQGFIDSVIKKKLASGTGRNNLLDLRGKHSPSHKITEEKMKAITDHINRFPAYESHYTRRDSSVKYLHSDVNLSKMFSLYVETTQDPVSLSKYSEVFRSMNLKFKSPKADTCNRCDVFKNKHEVASSTEEKDIIKRQQTEHHEVADLAYKSKEADTKAGKLSPAIKVFTFDLQKCLPTPNLSTSLSFYKRQLWTFNLTVHDNVTGIPYCYMWYETIANRGGNEIASCLFKHLTSQLPDDAKNIIFYSDNCVGQNKNSIVAVMFMIFVMTSSTISQIDHKYLECGHTHMECDTDHSIIERKKKRTNTKIEVPRDWFQFIRGVGTTKQFEVIEMEQASFINFAQTIKTKFTWRRVDEQGNPFVWSKVKWIRYTKEFGILQYKYTLNEDDSFHTLNIRKRGVNAVLSKDLQLCYDQPINISKEKKKDLIDLLPLIDPSFHSFYKNLPAQNMLNFHPDLTQEDEIETESA